MSWTRLRGGAKSGGLLRFAEVKHAAEGMDIGLAPPGAGKPGLRVLSNYAALTALACSVVIGSLAAAPGRPGLFGAGLGLLMIAIAVADARAFRIPDRLTLAAFLLALADTSNQGFANMPENIALAALRGLVLALMFFGVRDIYCRLRRRHGIGLGDVKLAAVAGAWLDWPLIPVSIEIAAVLALIVYCSGELISQRPLRATAKLPFGLFFAPAIWFCWFSGRLFWQS